MSVCDRELLCTLRSLTTKTYTTYADMLADRCRPQFSLVLTGVKSGFYIKVDDVVYKVGELIIPSNAVPPTSEGVTPEEAAQILVKWTDITDRPISTPSQIDEAVLSPTVPDWIYSKVIMTVQPPDVFELSNRTWYIIRANMPGDFYLRLPANAIDLDSIKVSVIGSKVANIIPPTNGTINGTTTAAVVTNGSAEFVFNESTNDWLMIV